jgi:hypothetical protein
MCSRNFKIGYSREKAQIQLWLINHTDTKADQSFKSVRRLLPP